MNAHHFNAMLLLAWFLVLFGGCQINFGAGLLFAGLLLIAILFFVARLAGIYLPKNDEGD